ncbi:MAG: zinc ABC transporter substrate-binding protein [Myxococcales bacterium]|nr:zinc ABC transporter substrate-binding protein [Myxococcales bacterium]
MRLLASLLALLVAGPALARVKVVATLPDLAALAAAVGGDAVEVTALVAPTQDPHYVDPRPSYVLALSQADLLVVNGLELEAAWLGPLRLQARNPRVLAEPGYVDASTAVHRLGATATVDRSQGDIHPGGNPHFTHDPRAGAAIAALIAQRLAAVDPPHAAEYAQRAEALRGRLDTLAKATRARFAALSADQRRVVAYHESLAYLLDWLDLTRVATVEPKPGIPPDPAQTSRVLQAMKSTGVRVIVQEVYYPARIPDTLARLVGGSVVRLPGGAAFADGETYEAHVAAIAEALYAALAR